MTREKQLEAAIQAIWDAYGVVVSNNGVSGVMSRHLVPAINDAYRLLPHGKKDIYHVAWGGGKTAVRNHGGYQPPPGPLPPARYQLRKGKK